MGIVKNIIKRAAVRGADTVAKLAVLSPEQLADIQKRREEYLRQVPRMDDEVAEELTKRLLASASIEIFNEYLQHLRNMYVPVRRSVEYEGDNFDASHNIRFFNITKWVTDKKENSIEKLINVYQVLSNEQCNIALVFNRTCDVTKVFLAVVDTKNAEDNIDVESYRKRLAAAIKGNFPGAVWTDKNGIGILPCLKNNIPYSVATASNIPGEKSEKFISQTIEKLLDGIVPESIEKEYTIILLATPVGDVENRKLHLAELYSGLATYAGWQTNFTYTESSGANSSATFGVNAGVSAGIQQGHTNSVANTSGTTDSTGETNSKTEGNSESDSISRTDTYSRNRSDGFSKSESKAKSRGTINSHTDSSSKGVSGGVDVGIASGGGNLTWGKADTSGSTISNSTTTGTTKTASESMGKAISDTIGKTATQSIANTVSKTLGHAVSQSVTQTAGALKGASFGGSFGANFARASNVTATVGKNEGITQSFTNYNIKHTLEILEQQIKRYEQSTALGMWDFAAYILSEDYNVANNVAHAYLALTQGEQSYMSQTAVNLWRGDMGKSSEDAKEICSYLRELRHPLFGLNRELTIQDPDFNAYPTTVTAATSLSGKELAYSLNFPQKSIVGLPVIECAEFGRNVVGFDAEGKIFGTLRIGSIYHMNRTENMPVALVKKSLTSHTFITGSTGSGKSNAVYQLLSEAAADGVKFLIVEPAKGEYKHVFGSDGNVSVYGTNPYITPLLRLNPFSFPKEIHVLEHLDRLVEIFNVCWPMYAAMPAVLKNAIEKAYLNCGWDLLRSTNKYGADIYPTFADVTENIRKIIETSEYDAENKGAYKGSLVTRLQSLTNGINGTIFSGNEISSCDLFDKNVIIDLSRVGSSETKSLIMGMLILKLQEYRTTNADEMNSDLKHITVLEEAHNILRRTSFEHSTEGSSLMGKSVEMISNAIAEMRTFGEGFIIVDQAPALLDMSAIRNTNTKIIMRLPDHTDRELVGKAANLNDDQIIELAKLPCGVAAVYQNEWIQPVLCKIDKFKLSKNSYHYVLRNDVFDDKETEYVSNALLDCIMNNELFGKDNKTSICKLKEKVMKSQLKPAVKVGFMEYLLSNEKNRLKCLKALIYDLLSAGEAVLAAKRYSEIVEWTNAVVDGLRPSIIKYSGEQINLAMGLLVQEQAFRDTSYLDLYCRFTEKYKADGKVF